MSKQKETPINNGGGKSREVTKRREGVKLECRYAEPPVHLMPVVALVYPWTCLLDFCCWLASFPLLILHSRVSYLLFSYV
jgi:hypothetical protein